MPPKSLTSDSGIKSLPVEEEVYGPSLPKEIPFYPNMSYVKGKGKAPEYFPIESLAAIAQAEAQARRDNVLPNNYAVMALPNFLTEKRPIDFGVDYGIHAPHGKNTNAERMGLTAESIDNVTQTALARSNPKYIPGKNETLYPVKDPGEGKLGTDNEDQYLNTLNHNARLAVAQMANKTKDFKWSPDGMILAWNNESKNHLRKVKEMQRMLDHPSNAGIRLLYEDLLKQY